MISLRFLMPAFIIALISVSSVLGNAYAVEPGTVYIDPSNVPALYSGQIFGVDVKVSNLGPFNGFDIMVQVDRTVLAPESINDASSLFRTTFGTEPYFWLYCVNGYGAGCMSSDKPGVAHFAAKFAGPPPMNGPVSGTLFTVYFSVENTSPPPQPGTPPPPGVGSTILIVNEIITNDQVPLAHSVAHGSYGTPPPVPIQGPDFIPTRVPTWIGIVTGSSGSSDITVYSAHGYSGSVQVRANVEPAGISATVQPQDLAIAPEGFAVSTLVVSASPSSAPKTYKVNVTFSDGLKSHWVTVYVQVTTGLDPALFIEPPVLVVNPDQVFTVAVRLAHMTPFSSWDISVRVDPSILEPQSISLEGNFLDADFGASIFELYRCVYGVGGCSGGEAPGTVRSAAAAFGSSFTSGEASGLLFTVTYRAKAPGISPVDIFNDILLHPDPISHGTVDGQVTVLKSPDLNGDMFVDILDMAAIAVAFGTSPPASQWNPKADLDDNLRIDIVDVATAAVDFGKAV